jgi:hypothetical protein
MVNMISNAEAAADACAGSGVGAFLPQGARTVTANGMGAKRLARPRAASAVGVFGQCRNAAGHGTAAGRGQALGLQNPSKQYPHTTRIAAASGGGLGPYPARDPV